MGKIGLLFGSFNPIHNGHLAVANAALGVGCDDVWMVVQARNPYKESRDVPSFFHRKAMVDLAVSPYQRVHSWELQQDPPHIITTLLTLRAQEPHHQFVLLMGQDLVDSLPHWPDFREIIATAEIYCYPRISDAASSFQHRRIHHLNTKHMNVSSGLIRDRLTRNLPIHPLLPHPVAQYIKQNKLYV